MKPKAENHEKLVSLVLFCFFFCFFFFFFFFFFFGGVVDSMRNLMLLVKRMNS